MTRISTFVIAIAFAALPSAALAQPAEDQLTCFKVKDSAPKAQYQVSLSNAGGSQTCTVKVPARLACVQTAETSVTPAPPGGGPQGSPAAGALLCYRAQCAQPLGNSNAEDPFGRRLISFRGARLLCAPAIVAAPTPGTTTTTLPGTPTGCSFRDGQCQGTCGAGMRCGAAVGTGSCECRSVSCGDASAPTCDGACSNPGEACTFSFTGCSCVRIP